MTISADRFQRGLATLLFCAILLGAATTLVFTLARTGLAEQRISSNIHRHEYMRQGGDAGLAYAIAWLRTHAPVWQQTATGLQTTTIAIPGDNLGQDPALTIQIDGLRLGSATAYALLEVQAWYPDSDPLINANRYREWLYVHINVIDHLAYAARITPLPGTWHDFGHS